MDDDYISPADEAGYLEYLAWRAAEAARPANPNDSGWPVPTPDDIPF